IGGLLANVSDASAVSRSANRRGSVESMILKTSVGVTMLLVVMGAPGFVDPSGIDGTGRGGRCRRESHDGQRSVLPSNVSRRCEMAPGRCPVVRWQHCTPVLVYVSTLWLHL